LRFAEGLDDRIMTSTASRLSGVSEQNNRGEIVYRLLDGRDELLDTPNGRVFADFHP
jgi:hypothetical protein